MRRIRGIAAVTLLGSMAVAFVLAVALTSTTRPSADHSGPRARRSADTPHPPEQALLVAIPEGEKPCELKLGEPVVVRRQDPNSILAGNSDIEQEFSSRGVRLRAGKNGLDFSLKEIRIGGRSVLSGPELTGVSPRRAAPGSNDVAYHRGGVSEKYVLLDRGVEQVFVLDESLQALRSAGDLAITVALETSLQPTHRSPAGPASGDVIDLKDRTGATQATYGAATAIDASGRRQPLAYALRGNDLVMTLDAGFLSSARFPLVVDPDVTLSSTSLSVTVGFGSTAIVSRSVTLTNVGPAGNLSWTAVASTTLPGTWLKVTPRRGKLKVGRSKKLTISFNPTGLAAGSYTGKITIGGNVTNPPQEVSVTLNVVTTPIIDLNPLTLIYDSPVGGPASPNPQQVILSNSGGGTLNWVATPATTSGGAWLSVDLTSGTLTAGQSVPLNVLVDPAGLTSAGSPYGGSINVTGTDGLGGIVPPNAVAVTLNVNDLPKIILSTTPATSPVSLTFTDPLGGPNVDSPQIVRLTNGGTAPLNWTATPATTSGGPWLSVLPASAALPVGPLGPGAYIDLFVSVDVAGLAAASYIGTITVSDPSASNDPQTVTVFLDVVDTPDLTLTPLTMTFTQPLGSGLSTPQPLTVANTGFGTLAWTATVATSTGGSWLLVNQASGSLLTGQLVDLDIQVDLSVGGGLAAGTYSGTITIDSSTATATNVPQDLVVTLNVYVPPTLSLSTSTLTFDAPLGGPNPASQSVSVTNSGTGTLAWSAAVGVSAPWLSVAPANGSLKANETRPTAVSVDASGLAAGIYTGTITVSGTQSPGITPARNSPRLVLVTLNVNDRPKIGLDKTSLVFDAPLGGPNTTSPQAVQVSNVGAGTLTWSASEAAPWLNLSPSGGSLSAGQGSSMAVSIDVTAGGGLAAGTYTAPITVSGNGTNSPRLISVTLNVHDTPTIFLDPTALTFDVPLAGPNPLTAKTVTLTNVGAASLDWTAVVSPVSATWLVLAPPTTGTRAAGASTSLSVNVDVVTGALAAGTYIAKIVVSGAAGTFNSPQEVTVTLNVNDLPAIGLDKTSLTFDKPFGGPDPASQTFSVSNVGAGNLDWTAAITPVSATWLTVSPLATAAAPPGLAAGGSETLTVSVDVTGLAPGTYVATITVSAAGASNSPKTVFVSLSIGGPPPALIAKEIVAGYCGALGLEFLIPPGLMLLVRRARAARRRRTWPLAMVLSLATLGVGAQAARAEAPDEGTSLPRMRLQEPEPPPRPTLSQLSGQEAPASDLVDLGQLELSARVGFAAFSSDFEADPRITGSIGARAPMPWLSKDVLGLDRDSFGLFAEVMISGIDRDIDNLKDSSGTLFFAALGIDYTLYQDESFFVRAELGLQYGYFGGVTDLKNGVAALVGLAGGIQITPGFWATVNPEVGVGGSRGQVFFIQIGAALTF